MATKKAATPKPVRFSTITGTVEGFISDGFSEITGVGEEFREIVDNAPDGLKESGVNITRGDTADAIDGFSEPSVDSSILGELECTTQIDNGKTYRGRQSQSRACRAANGAAQLRAAAEAIRAWLEDNDELPEADDRDAASLKQRLEKLEELETAGIDPDDYDKAREEADELASSLDEIADEVEGLEYPGMFG